MTNSNEIKLLNFANICQIEAHALYDAHLYAGCVSRSCNSVFNPIRSVLLSKDIDVKPHNTALTLFHQHFVKTGVFTEVKHIPSRMKNARLKTDYSGYRSRKKEAEEALFLANQFYDTIKNYLDAKS